MSFLYETLAVEFRGHAVPGTHRLVLPLEERDLTDPRFLAALAYIRERLDEQLAASASAPPSMGPLASKRDPGASTA